jgi:flagellar motor switch protein FliM
MDKLADHLMDIPFTVEATLKGPVLRVAEILCLAPGNVIPTRHQAGEALDVMVGRSLLGVAELGSENGQAVVRMIKFRDNI